MSRTVPAICVALALLSPIAARRLKPAINLSRDDLSPIRPFSFLEKLPI